MSVWPGPTLEINLTKRSLPGDKAFNRRTSPITPGRFGRKYPQSLISGVKNGLSLCSTCIHFNNSQYHGPSSSSQIHQAPCQPRPSYQGPTNAPSKLAEFEPAVTRPAIERCHQPQPSAAPQNHRFALTSYGLFAGPQDLPTPSLILKAFVRQQ